MFTNTRTSDKGPLIPVLAGARPGDRIQRNGRPWAIISGPNGALTHDPAAPTYPR